MTNSTKRQIGRSAKRLNKRLNKLAKKGKLRNTTKDRLRKIQFDRKSKKRQKQEKIEADWQANRELLRAQEENDDVLPLDMIDPDDDYIEGFGLNLTVRTEAKRRKIGETDEEGDVDIPRTFKNVSDVEYKLQGNKLKHLLPVKTEGGRIVSRYMEISEKLDEEEARLLPEVKDEKKEKKDEEKEFGSVAEMYVERSRLLREYKEKIASFSNHVVENPEEKVHKLKELLHLAEGKEVPPLVSLTVQKLATLSLLTVFLNIIPGYRIRERTEEEKEQKLKKETKKLVEFEEALLRNYRKYLQHFEFLIQGSKDNSGKRRKEGIMVKQKKSLARVAVSCLCKLIMEHPHFNFRGNIIAVLVPLAGSKTDVAAGQECCDALKTVMKDDKTGEAALEVVKCINKYVKNNSVAPALLSTFTALQIKDVDKVGEEKKRHKNKKQLKRKEMLKQISKKEKKYQKQLELLERELRETEAEENRHVKLTLHTQIMNEVFTTYFRVLKKKDTTLLPPVLEGLSKFAHLINVEFFDDMISSLRELVEGGGLKTLESLYCIKTAFTILSGEGQSLNIDPHRFYQLLFSLVPGIATEKNFEYQKKQFCNCLQCLDLMVLQRRKTISLSRVSGFAKRLSLVTLILHPSLAAGSLAMLRRFFIAVPKLDGLLEEEAVGSGKYLPLVDDPEHCNAFASNILGELHILKENRDQNVRQLAANILNGRTSKLPPHSLEMKPWDFFNESTKEIHENSDFLQVLKCLSKKALLKRDGTVCLEIEKYIKIKDISTIK